MKYSGFLAILLVIAAVAIIFGFANPAYEQVQALKVRISELKQTLEQANRLKEKRSLLIARKSSIPTETMVALERFLPRSIDMVRLILEVDTVARANQVATFDFEVASEKRDDVSASQQQGATASPPRPYRWFELSFTASGTYANLVKTLNDLERSLRLIDIVGVSIKVDDAALTTTAPRNAVHSFDVTLRTYWFEP